MAGFFSPQRDRRTAFTLVEMLVVISLITLLIGIILPSLRSSRDSAYAGICTSNLRQIMIANHAYTNDNKGLYPFPNWGGNGRDLNDGNSPNQKWRYGGWLYFNKANASWNNNSFWTPQVLETGLIYQYMGGEKSAYRCPKQDPPFPPLSGQITSYNMNGSVCAYGQPRTYRMDQFRPSDLIMWEVDPDNTSTGAWWDGANQPFEGIGTRWHALGGTAAANDTHIEWMRHDDFAVERLKPQPNRLYNTPGS